MNDSTSTGGNPATVPATAPATAFDEIPHILVIDDDTRLRDLLRKYLSDNGYRVTTAENAADARRKMEGLLFDLLVLDRMMPGEDGLDLARALRAEGRERLPILMLTAMTEAEDRISGLEGGVDDYLPKPFEPRELLLRIGAILRRSRPQESRSVRFGDFTFDLERGELCQQGERVYLTSGETALLKALASRPGTVVSREQLSLSGGGQGRAVDVQITRLRRKIEDDAKEPRHLQTIRGEGYVLWTD